MQPNQWSFCLGNPFQLFYHDFKHRPVSANRRRIDRILSAEKYVTTGRILLLLVILYAAFFRFFEIDRLPPGLFYDEAFNGVDARRVIEGIARPVFFHGNNGREALFIYLQSIAVLLLGFKAFALRIVAAFVGVLTIPAVFVLIRTLLSEKSASANSGNQHLTEQKNLVLWTALIGAACIAISYWHVSVSRLGFRANLLPLVSTIAVVYFWRAWRQQRRNDYLWAGVWLGIAFYTYTSARLLPFVLFGFIAVEFLIVFIKQRRRTWRDRLIPLRQQIGGLTLTFGIMLLIAAPFFYEVIQHPYLINARTQDVSIFTVPERYFPGAPLERLTHNIGLVIRSFYDMGDINPRHNLPGRPVNDVLMAILFTLGSVMVVFRAQQAQMRLIMIWLAVMILPTVLSVEAPHSLRALGILSPIAVLYGLGGDVLIKVLSRRISLGQSGMFMVFTVLLISGSITFYDYFNRWAQLPGLGYAFDLQQQLAAEETARILEQTPETPLVISRQLYLTPQMRFAIGAATPDDLRNDVIPAALLENGKFLFEEFPDDPNQAVILLWMMNGQRTATWLDPRLPDSERFVMDALRKRATPTLVQSPIQQEAWPRIVTGVFEPTNLAVKTLDNPMNVNFANGLSLVGYEIRPNRIDPGDEVPYFFLTLYWRDLSGAGRSPGEQFDLFTHLRFGNGQSEDNMYFGSGYGISLWQPGELVDTRRLLHVPDDAESGRGYIEVGLYDPSPTGDGARVPIIDGNGQIAGTSVRFGGVMIGQPPPQADTTDLAPLETTFDHRIELVGWNLKRVEGPGNALEIDLAWRALGRPIADYTAFVHLVDKNGDIVTQFDQPPGGTDAPTSLWVPDEVVRATFPLSLPIDVSIEELRIRTGLYEPIGGRQATITECKISDDICRDSYLLLPTIEQTGL